MCQRHVELSTINYIMGLFDFLFGDDSSNDHGIDEQHFGRDRFGYYTDEENLYDDDSTWQDDDF